MRRNTEVLIRQGENIKAILSRFEITEQEFGKGALTYQQNINRYVTGEDYISEKKEEDIIKFLKQKYDFDLNPGFVRGLNDRMEAPKLSLIEVFDESAEEMIAEEMIVEDVEGMIAEEKNSDAVDDSVLSLLSALGYSFTVSGVSKYDIRVKGRIVCESVNAKDVNSLFDQIREYAETKAEILIKHSKPKK